MIVPLSLPEYRKNKIVSLQRVMSWASDVQLRQIVEMEGDDVWLLYGLLMAKARQESLKLLRRRSFLVRSGKLQAANGNLDCK